MEYSMKNLLRFRIRNEEQHQLLCEEVSEIEMIIALQCEYLEDRLTREQGLDVAFKRMRKEIELKEKYEIPIWHEATLEWFHASLDALCNEYLER